jgi:pimeloyl-ACP methyl ester carboxylesterase
MTEEFESGQYSVFAKDEQTGLRSVSRTFIVENNQIITSNLFIVSPTNKSEFIIYEEVVIRWRDMADYGILNRTNGKMKVKYKIESQRNEGSWILIKDDVFEGNLDQVIPNSITHSFAEAGNYRIRITNLDAPNRSATTLPFVVRTLTGGINVEYVWDYTVPNRLSMNPKNPKGVVTDGTSRIFLKINTITPNIKTIKSVKIELSDPDGFNTSQFLGKVKKALGINGYGLEGNDAVNIQDISEAPSDGTGGFWFWYVAPDDFTRSSIDDFESSRKVNLKITTIYTDNTQEINSNYSIEIVRPPVMFVHGYAGDNTAFNNFKFMNANNDPRLFVHSSQIVNNDIFKVARATRLNPAGSYYDNAKILLNAYDDGFKANPYSENSFQNMLREMHKNGYACNRTDYVAHSMGGASGRRAIEMFNNGFLRELGSNPAYNTYKKGYVNKLITIQTPYNGSKWADLANDLPVGLILKKPKLYIGLIALVETMEAIGGQARLFATSTYTKARPLGIPTSFINGTTDVIKDMKYDGGYKFSRTYVKNHLIGTQVSSNWPLVPSDIEDYFEEIKGSGFYKIMSNINFGQLDKYKAILDLPSQVNYLVGSDLVVNISSQIPQRYQNPNDLTTSRFTGFKYHHLKSRDRIEIGQKVFQILNDPILGNRFADYIASNSESAQEPPLKAISTLDSEKDTAIIRYDTSMLKILKPKVNDQICIDDQMKVEFKMENTGNLIDYSIAFQGEVHTSTDKNPYQSVEMQANPIMPGNTTLYVYGNYDSSGYTITYYDSTIIMVNLCKAASALQVNPHTITIDSGFTYTPQVTLLQDQLLIYLHNKDTSLMKTVFDNTIVDIDSSGLIYAKKSGSTSIFYEYNGLLDTLYVFVPEIFKLPEPVEIEKGCSGSNFILASNFVADTYTWQIDSGYGFIDLGSTGIVQGADNDTLSLISPSPEWLKYKFRCIGQKGEETFMSSTFTIRYETTWTGNHNDDWHNVLNWSCGIIPDKFSDVIISNTTNIPKVKNNASIRSIKLMTDAKLNINEGIRLDVKE